MQLELFHVVYVIGGLTPIPIAQPQDKQEGLRAALGALPSVSSLAAGLPCAIFYFGCVQIGF